MEQDSIFTIALTLITALTSAKGWDYWQNRATDKKQEKKEELQETHLYRDDLRKEVQRLREELIALYAKREEEMEKILRKDSEAGDEMHNEISELREQLATFKTRVEFLEKENATLKSQITN